MKWILRYIKCAIYISFFFGVDTWQLTGFVNSDYVCDLDRQQSTKSYMFKIHGVTLNWKYIIEYIDTL